MCYVGLIEDHVKQSTGGDSNLMSHYVTSYNSSYGRPWELFQPRKVHFRGTGYISNERPCLQFKPSLDEIDNREFGACIRNPYLSVTRKDFISFSRPNGKEALPTLSKFSPANSYKISVQKSNGFSPVGQSEPLAPDSESHRSVYQVEFQKPERVKYDNERMDAGVKCETGSTRNQSTVNILSGRPIISQSTGSCNWQVDRPTGSTCYKDAYQAYTSITGKEPLPRFTENNPVTRASSYIEQNKHIPDYVPSHLQKVYTKIEDIPESKFEIIRKTDPAEHQNIAHGSKEPSMYRGMFDDGKFNEASKVVRLGNRNVGAVTASGFTSNETGPVDGNSDCGRFRTHYSATYYPVPPSCDKSDRQGHIHFNTGHTTITAQSTGSKLSGFEAQTPATLKLDQLSPYQARSVSVRDRLGIPMKN